MAKEILYKVISVIILLLIILVCVYGIAPRASEPETYKSTIQKLEKKQKTILEMTGTAAAASIAIGAIPGDATTPIANKVVDMAGYFIVILSVVILEKYMLTIAGYLTFTWLIPIACLLFAVNVFVDRAVLRHIAVKIVAFGLSLVMLVPVSVKLTDVIEKTHEVSINTTIDNVKEIQKEAEESIDEETEEIEEEEGEGSSPFDVIGNVKSRINQLTENTKNAIQGATSSVVRLSDQVIEKAKDTLNDFVEVVVIMLVTTCGVPIVTVLVFVFLIKSFLSIDLVKLWDKASSRQIHRREHEDP